MIDYRWPVGKFRGVSIKRTPTKFLEWAERAMPEPFCVKAREELDRRGTSHKKIQVSDHAIDRASTRLLKLWMDETSGEIGLYSWLAAKADQALDTAEFNMHETIVVTHEWITYVFDMKMVIPVLMTVRLKE